MLLLNVGVCYNYVVYGYIYIHILTRTYYNFLVVPTFCPPVRLAGGISENEGRVEIYYNNTWETVCDGSHWSITDSNTVCRQLGYTGATNDYTALFIDYGNVPVWMGIVQCGSYDLCLGNCNFNGFGNTHCRHFQDVFVNCTGMRDSDKLGTLYIV